MLFNNNHIAVDWDKNDIRILNFRKEGSGKVKVLHAVQTEIPSEISTDNADQFGEFLSRTIRSHDISTTSVIFMVGRERAFLHQLAIPASPEGEVANLVRFQLAQELPFAIEESTIDYIVTAHNDAGAVIGVLAAAVQTEYIDFLRHLARSAGLTLKRVGLRSYGNFMAVKTADYLDGGLYLFADLGLSGLEIDILSKEGGLVYSRSAGLSDEKVQATPLKQVFLEQAILQVKRTLHAQAYLAGTPDSRPRSIIVSGCTGWEREFLDAICNELNLSGKVFELPNNASVENSSAFIAGYGIACAQYRPRQEHFDFLVPKKAIDPQAVRTRQIRLAVAVVAAIMILAAILTHSKVSEKEKELKQLNARSREMDKELVAFRKFVHQTGKVNEWGTRKVNWLDEIKSLTQLLPGTDKMYVKHMFLTESPSGEYRAEITLEGQAKSRQIIDQLAKTLSDTGRYEVVPGPQITLQGDDYSENFKLNLKVSKADGEGTPTTGPASELSKDQKTTPSKMNKSEV